MVAWESQPEQARIYMIPLGCYVGRVSSDSGGVSLAGGGIRFAMARIIIQDFGKRCVDEIVPFDALDAILKKLPKRLAANLQSHITNIASTRQPIPLSGLERPLMFDKPLVMGVLNVTPDSFSDGGKFVDLDKAISHAIAMHDAGVDIIDIGGESTRPGAKAVWEGEEKERVLPVIEALQARKVPISLDSRNAAVMEAGLEAGAHIINDVSALTYDDRSMSVISQSTAPIILMHSKGDPKTMQNAPSYEDVVLDVFDYLEERIECCVAAGIDKARIIVDPGIGFGKRVVKDNLALINNLSIFHGLGCPLLLGVSRKRFIGALTDVEDAQDRMAGSLAAGMAGLTQGVQILRVHDVEETLQAVKIHQGLNDAALMDMLSY